jgi:DnaJ-class molecular chaperone
VIRICQNCEGTGIDDAVNGVCDRCSGSGAVEKDDDDHLDYGELGPEDELPFA